MKAEGAEKAQPPSVNNNKPVMAPQGKDSKDQQPNAQNNVMLHVGMVVNGFEIQKLIGKNRATFILQSMGGGVEQPYLFLSTGLFIEICANYC